ncbi:hypothetical protein [Bradyrhizobium iriomotense]|uniref:hypothetical protein n=1 Tax=Bradyrhizobium iriomotense TaxID=441950 RepID=UPI001B8A0DA4|nr:hypothetical protein [Bradyrhizobium iriomotense]MBR0781080.1 hypothetical protein [Bradyrhizobium iriomotense]
MSTSRVRKFICAALAGTYLAAAPVPTFAQSPAPIDRLGIPGPIEFAGTQYHLAWSAQPSADYIKHEYLPLGQKPASYADMVSVELLTSGISVADAARAQTTKLDKRKGSDPLANYQLLQNPNNSQVVLDFLMSDESTGALIVEWDAYRYVSVAMPDGKNAVILFAISRRHYGAGAGEFLKSLKTKRTADINALVSHAIPGAEPSR